MRVKKSHDVIKKRCEKHEVSEEDNSVKCEKKKNVTLELTALCWGLNAAHAIVPILFFFNNSGTK